MDIYETTKSVVEDVYRVTLFIYATIQTAKNYPSSIDEVQDQLGHEILFVETFRELFLDADGVLFSSAVGRLSETKDLLVRDVSTIFRRLKSALAEYAALAEKHRLLLSEDDAEASPSKGVDPVPGKKGKLKDRMIESMRRKRVETIGLKFEWALFDQEKVTEMLATYALWTTKLKDNMALLFSISPQSPISATTAKDLGMEDIIRRQQLQMSSAPDDLAEIEGTFVDDEDEMPAQGVRIMMWDDGTGFDEKPVLVEYRPYSSAIAIATSRHDAVQVSKLQKPLKDLAWLLQTGSKPDSAMAKLDVNQHASLAKQNKMHILECLGYKDQPERKRSILLYDLPFSSAKSNVVISLHDFINLVAPPSKPPLERRFFMAYALASTVFSVHASSWLHKNISSRGILLFPEATRSETSEELTPFLADWGVARPITGDTELSGDMDPEANWYRHPERQGKPKRAFNVEHDLYSVGVVLLEIGLWKTLSTMLKKVIDNNRKLNTIYDAEESRKQLVKLAGRGPLAQEMGTAYATIVLRCLQGNFGVDEEETDDQTAIKRGYYKNVVEAVRQGVQF